MAFFIEMCAEIGRVLCETLGFERYVRHERAETLKRAQETLDILSGNKQ